MKRFEGKSVLITGAGSGIGAATARRFFDEGANLVLGDQNEDTLGWLVADLGGDEKRIASLVGDVAVLADVEALIILAEKRFGGLHVLINNAGIGSIGATPDLETEHWQRVIDVDLNSVFYGCRAGIPLMRKSGGGSIINTASVSGLGGDCGFGAYNAAKGGVVNYTRALAIDHAPEGIRVNSICPGIIETALSAGLFDLDGFAEAVEDNVPMGRAGRADEVSGAIAFLASEDASYITGATIVIDGGVTATTGQVNFPKIINRAIQGASS